MKHHDEKGHHAPAQSAAAKRMRGKEEKVFKEAKEGKLHSGSKKGPVVKEKKQVEAIALSEGRKAAHEKKRK